MDISDPELKLLIKSLGITCSVVADKLDRLPNPSRAYAKALAELELGRVLVHKLDDEHSRRLGLTA